MTHSSMHLSLYPCISVTTIITTSSYREFIYLEVKDKDMLTSTEIGMTKIALRDIPNTRIDQAYEVGMHPANALICLTQAPIK